MEGNEVTVEIEREIKDGKPTSTLWVHMINGAQKTPLREVAWVFEKDEGECWIGVYAAKPSKDEHDGEGSLEVEFTDLALESF